MPGAGTASNPFFTKPRSPNAVPSLQNAGPALISVQYAYSRPAQESRSKTVLDRYRASLRPLTPACTPSAAACTPINAKRSTPRALLLRRSRESWSNRLMAAQTSRLPESRQCARQKVRRKATRGFNDCADLDSACVCFGIRQSAFCSLDDVAEVEQLKIGLAQLRGPKRRLN